MTETQDSIRRANQFFFFLNVITQYISNGYELSVKTQLMTYTNNDYFGSFLKDENRKGLKHQRI